MSKTIDERVVSMQFDNKNFESNVRTTMSTLEKLKARLNLSGASKGLESVNAAARNCNLSPIGNAVDSINVKFSKLQMAAAHALGDIATRAYRTGESILKSLTIQPITTGFNEYELKMNSIQTIMASTGESLETVNQYLNELNKYSDETIYSFADMTQNIGKFTNAGVKLEDAVTAIKGIANEAALSGANANEASRAMYNFSQALSTGYVQRIDWKSIELANMATVDFKERLLEQAVAMGTVTKNAEGLYAALGDDNFYNTSQMFIEALDEQWLTSEVLIETLKDYADETTEIGARATKAATEVKTFSHMMDTLRESAQSGWAQTWETILGDFNEGKTLWTSLNEVIGGWISKSADKRNSMLSNVLDSNWEKFAAKVEEAGVSVDDFQEKLKEVAKAEDNIDLDQLVEECGSLAKAMRSGKISTNSIIKTLKKFAGIETKITDTTVELSDKLKYFQDAVDRVWRGEFGNVDTGRVERLTKAGYDFATVQALVNRTVDGHRLTMEDLIAVQAEMSDAQLESIGYTEDQITALRELAKQAEQTGTPINELIENLSKPTGRELLIESFVTIFEKLKPVIEGLKATWDRVFGDFPTVGEILTDLIEKFADFADNLVINEDKIQSITTTFEGFLTVLKAIALLSGGATGYIFKLLNMVANELDVDFFNLTETVAEVIIQFYKWITTNNALYESMISLGNAVIDFVKNTINDVKTWFNEFVKIPQVIAQIEKLTTSFKTMLSNIGNWLGGFGTVFSEFFNSLLSLESITADDIISTVGELISGIFEQLRNVISGIDGPFTDFIDLIVMFFAELINGDGAVDDFVDNFQKIKETVNDIITPIGNAINKLLDWGAAFGEWVTSLKDAEDIPKAIGEGIGKVIGGLLVYIRDMLSQLGQDIWNGMTGVGEDGVAGLVAGLMNGIITVTDAIWRIGSSMISTICSVLAIHSPSRVMMAIGAFAILGLAIGLQQAAPEVWDAIVTFGTELISKFKTLFITVLEWVGGLNIGQLISVAITGGMLAFAVSVVKIGMRIADAVAGITEGLAGIAGGAKKILNNIADVFGEVAKNEKAKRFKIYAEAIKSLAIAIGILAASIAVLTLIDQDKMWEAVKALAAIIGVFTIFAGVVALAEKFGKISSLNFGAMAIGMAGMAIGISIVASAAKKLSEVPVDRIDSVIVGLLGIMIGLTFMTTMFGKFANPLVTANINKVGGVLIKLAAAMLIMAYVCKIAGSLTPSQAEQGWDAIIAFGVVIGALVGVGNFAGEDIEAIGNTLLKIGAVFLLMSHVAKTMGNLAPEEFNRGLRAIGAFAGIVVGIIFALDVLSSVGSLMGSTDIGDIGTTLLKIGGMMLMMTVAAKMMGSMRPEELLTAGIALVALTGLITLLLFVLERINAGNLEAIGSTVLMISGAMMLLAVAAKILGSIPWQQLLVGGAAIMVLGVGIAGLIHVLGKIDAKNLKGVGVTLLLAAGAIAILATIATVIGLIDLPILAKGIVAVSILGAMMALIIKSTEKATDAKSTLIGVAVAMAVLAAAVVALSFIDTNSLATSVSGLSIVMIVLAAMIDKIGSTKVPIGSIVAITGAVTVLGGLLFLLGQLNPGNALAAATALSLTMIALAGTMTIINKFGSASSGSKKFGNTLIMIGVLAAVSIALSAAILIIGQLDPGEALAAAGALSIAMLALVGAIVIINKFGSASSGGKKFTNTMTTLLLMTTAVAVIGTILEALGQLDAGRAFEAATALSLTMLALAGAMAIMGTFGSGGSVGSLLAMSVALIAIGAAMMMLAAIPADRLWSTFGALAASMAVLTVVIIALAAAFTYFAPGAALVVGALLAIAAVFLSVGAASIMVAGALYIVSGILPTLAEGLTTLITSLAGCSDSAWAFIGVCAALLVGITLLTAGAAIFTVGATLMTTGLVILSVGLLVVSSAVVIFSGALMIGAAAVYTMAGAIAFLGVCISEGLAAGIASGITMVTEAVSGLANGVIGTICSVLGINSPSWVMQLLGQYTGQGFALGLSSTESDVSGAASGLATAAETGMGSAGAEGGTAFNTEALNNMDLSSIFSGEDMDTSALTSMFSNTGTESGNAFNAGALEGMDLSSILSGEGIDTSSLTSMFGNLGTESGTALTTGASESASMQPALDAMLGEISDTTPQFTEAGGNVLKAFGDGLTEASSSVTENLSAIVENMATSAKGGWSSFYSAGKHLVSGFSSGISANAFRAEAAAAAMATAAYEAAKEALDINSPSKVFRSIGKSVPEGFAMGIGMLGGTISDSVDTMAGSAIDGTRDIISRIADVIDADIDSQPTIRPVLDLSDVTSGVNSMDGMFGMRPSVRVMSDVGTISSMMNRRQNGGSADIISAISDLGRKLGSTSGDSYTINGINLSSDAEVAEAFKVIVRKAQIERRM